MEIKMERCDWMEDWYTIVKVEKPGEHKEGMSQIGPNSFSMFSSDRLSDADCEGTADEMRVIMQAILDGSTGANFKRCAVSKHAGDNVIFWSPRNSDVRTCELVPIADARAMATAALAELDGTSASVTAAR